MNPESSRSSLPPEVEAWLDEQGRADRRALEEVWHVAGAGRIQMDVHDLQCKAKVRDSVSRVIDSSREAESGQRLHVVRSTWRWFAAAAVLAILLGAAYLLRPVTVHAPYGEFAEATLPDGSRVHLNSGSTITFPAHFVGTRNVELRGQAYFDVLQQDDAFVVETFNARVSVLGTEFDVRARDDDAAPRTSVVVIAGRVAVSLKGGLGDSVVVTPGERSTVIESKGPTPPAEVHVQREIAWRHGGLAFNDQPFSEIFAEMERRFDIEIEAPINLQEKRFSLYKHDPSSAEVVLSDLSQAEGLRFRETANGFEVYRP